MTGAARSKEEDLAGDLGPEWFFSPAQRAAAAREAGKSIAEGLASRVAPGVIAFKPGPVRTDFASWFCDDSRLLAVVVALETVDVTEPILACALACRHNRDLMLVLPRRQVGVMLERLSWIDTPVRVFTYGVDFEPRAVIIPDRPDTSIPASRRLMRSPGDSGTQGSPPSPTTSRRWSPSSSR